MPALNVIRVGDFCTGHPELIPGRQAITGSTTVFINNIPVARQGDNWNVHGVPPHMGVGMGGSLSVFCEGLPVMRTGDIVSCGSIAGPGSIDTFCG